MKGFDFKPCKCSDRPILIIHEIVSSIQEIRQQAKPENNEEKMDKKHVKDKISNKKAAALRAPAIQTFLFLFFFNMKLKGVLMKKNKKREWTSCPLSKQKRKVLVL